MLTRALAVTVACAALGCTSLPDSDTTGAQVYARRCGECHRAYQPGSLTWPMWQYQLGRMQTLFVQLRKPWLSSDEEGFVRQYLEQHAGGR